MIAVLLETDSQLHPCLPGFIANFLHTEKWSSEEELLFNWKQM